MTDDRSRVSHTGFILWFTGVSGAGKTTLARAIHTTIAKELPAAILDGDEMRLDLCKDLSFSREDRDINISRIGFVARILARNGVTAIVAAISPYAESRNRIRQLAASDGLSFLEVHVTASLQSLIARDVKGLYARALAGELDQFTGISDPYEPPLNPEIKIYTDCEPVDISLQSLVFALCERGLIRKVK